MNNKLYVVLKCEKNKETFEPRSLKASVFEGVSEPNQSSRTLTDAHTHSRFDILMRTSH